MNFDKKSNSLDDKKHIQGLSKFLESLDDRSISGSFAPQRQYQNKYIQILKSGPDIERQVINVLQNNKELRDILIQKFIDNFEYKGMRDIQLFLINLILKTINEEERTYLLNKLYDIFKKDIIFTFDPPLDTKYEKELSILVEQVQPSKALLKILSGCILDCFPEGDPEFYRMYFFGMESIFVSLYIPIFLPELYNLFIKNRYDTNSRILLHLIQFFKMLWILIKLVPIQVEACIRAHMGKYGGEYDDYWDSCLDFVQGGYIYIQKSEKVIECKVYFENLGFTDYILEEDLKDWFAGYADSIIFKDD